MAKSHFGIRELLGRCAATMMGAALVAAPSTGQGAQPSGTPLAAASPVASAPRVAAFAAPTIPVLRGRLRPADIGLIVNLADPYSVAVGSHYRKQRGLSEAQVLELELPRRPGLTPAEFAGLQDRIASHFGDATQALVLAWVAPWAVACNSLTGALALGFDASLCEHSCRPSRPSPYFNHPSSRPWRDLGLRPAMQLAAPDLPGALRLIDRGVAADGALARRGAATSRARLLQTDDSLRNVRARLYPPAGPSQRSEVSIEVGHADARGGDRAAAVIVLQTGQAEFGELASQRWAPGALADHVTSFGGQLENPPAGQGSALGWIGAGATASHGSASEPCAHLQKFPHPQVLLGHYLQGATAIEAYWRSVAWPQQSVFIGEPLAAPFAPPRAAASERPPGG